MSGTVAVDDARATVGEALAEARRRLAAAGVEAPGLDARLLVQHVLESDVAAVVGHPERRLGPDEGRRLAALVARRCRREPLAHIVGGREFWSLPLTVSRDTLVPRPESETLVEAALDRVGDRRAPLCLLDLGTGSGCLLLALLSELPRAHGVGVDISPAAVAVARANAAALGLAGRAGFAVADWGDGLAGGFDIIVANLPYVAAGERQNLAPEIAVYEPDGAVFGGADGLDAYRRAIPQIARLLAPDGAGFLEIGAGQGHPVISLIRDRGLQVIEIRDDLAGIPRCVAVAPQTGAGS